MKILLFSVYDLAVGAHLQPFFSRSIGEAMRSFENACNDEKGPFVAHASDYCLFHLGSFDDTNGVFDCHPPQRLTSALEMLAKNAPPTIEHEIKAFKR
ncbi:nonstructural protein [Blackfly microvirus SF02]|uniref:Nonstructural protein n=1 Tax=Blackfly microvirus SF02 TaxID=2576452 RepID=A0A4V1F5G3_9VIRU|nr:nonstructural protein [Blackfly microvirus SF02]